MNYRNFDINTPTTVRPWGAREAQAWEDVIDTLVLDSVGAVADVTGHKHYRLFDADANARLTIVGLNAGLNTVEPLLNIGSASGNAPNVNGLHVKSDVANVRQCAVVIEGMSESSNGTSHSASSLIFADRAGGANGKIFEMIQSPTAEAGSTLEFRALNDNLTLKNRVALFDGTNQYIRHYHATHDVLWKDGGEFVDLDIYTVSATRGIIVEVDGQDYVIRLYQPPA